MLQRQCSGSLTSIEKAHIGNASSKGRHAFRGVKKPPRNIASRVFLIGALLTVVSVCFGIVAQEMRPVMAAIYFVLGFAMQRAGFCSASLISAVVLSRDLRGLVAILVAVLTAMLGFGLMHSLGLITVYPSRISLIPAAVGGLLFGIGMVFAGGCVSGSLFKATEGRWPSILAVMGIFLGMAAGMSAWGREIIAHLAEISSTRNPPPNLAATGGASFSHLATGIALIGLAGVSLGFRHQILAFRPSGAFPPDRRWPLFGVAVIVGLLGWAAFWVGPAVGRYYPLGASHIPSALSRLVLHGEVRLVGLLAWTFVLGSALSAWMRGQIRWRSAPRDTLVLAFCGGVLVGLGAIIGRGCFVGQILSGWALLSYHALIFGFVMILANWVTTLLYLRGWR
jgi:uncharacterized membrane protein YedE/YeeE